MKIELTDNLAQKSWILSDSDSEAIFKAGEFYDWLLDNGIFNEKDSEIWFLNARYEQYGDGWGGKCPYCKKEVRFYELSGDPIRLKCKNCGTKLSATSRTWISGNKLPLAYWRRAAWLLGQRLEISSNWLAEHLGVTQKTAYWMLCTIAEATKTRPVKTPLRVKLDAHGIEKCLLETADADLVTTEESNDTGEFYSDGPLATVTKTIEFETPLPVEEAKELWDKSPSVPSSGLVKKFAVAEQEPTGKDNTRPKPDSGTDAYKCRAIAEVKRLRSGEGGDIVLLDACIKVGIKSGDFYNWVKKFTELDARVDKTERGSTAKAIKAHIAEETASAPAEKEAAFGKRKRGGRDDDDKRAIISDIETKVTKGTTVKDACAFHKITDVTFYNWKNGFARKALAGNVSEPVEKPKKPVITEIESLAFERVELQPGEETDEQMLARLTAE